MLNCKFEVHVCDEHSRARRGTLHLPHGDVPTPIFMPVGTQATVKAMSPRELKEIDTRILLSNTYHLFLRPGHELIRDFGGLHSFMQWDRPILTDSGGFQVFSLSEMRKIREEGVEFRSHLDGSKCFITPEYDMEIQQALGADIAMAFDECSPYPCDYERAKAALGRTHRWAARCRRAHTRGDQALFGIVQGAFYKDLRIESAKTLADMDFPGYGIGGLSVGEPKPMMYELLEEIEPYMPREKPRYLMGVGSPDCLLEGVERGVDMFDCVMPTRNGRNGQLFTAEGVINIRNKKWEDDFSPIDPEGTAFVDTLYTKAYLHHLVTCGEMLAAQIASLHNIAFYLRLVGMAREHIAAGDFKPWKDAMVAKLTRRL